MVLDLDDLDHLVLRTLHVELDLRVLICGAYRAVWRRAFAVFAQGFGPELDEPGCEPLQGVGVGHHDPDVAPSRGIHEVVHGSPYYRRVLGAFLVHLVNTLRSTGE